MQSQAFETDTCNYNGAHESEDTKHPLHKQGSQNHIATATPAFIEDKTHLVYEVVIDQGQLYNDLTGRFPQRFS
jgi:hypothetical protein